MLQSKSDPNNYYFIVIYFSHVRENLVVRNFSIIKIENLILLLFTILSKILVFLTINLTVNPIAI